MRRFWSLALLASVAMGISTAQVPSLVGNWTGSQNAYAAEDGSYKLMENMSISLNILEQKDCLFKGNIAYTLNGKELVESFAGAIGLDNKTLYITESKKGYDLGTIISDDEVELIYLQDGAFGWASVEKLHRITR